MSSTNDSVPDRYLATVDRFIVTARGFVESGKGLESILFVGNLASSEHVAVLMDADNADAKEEAGNHARQVAAMLNADFSLLVGEAWALPQHALLRHEAIFEEYGSVGRYPGRIEVAIFVLETRYGFWSGQATLKPKGASKKRRTFGLVKFTKVDGGEGRLTNIIAKDSDASKAGLQ